MNERIDPLSLYVGDDIQITSKISVRQLKLSEIRDLGEGRYFQSVNVWTSIPSDAKSVLWDEAHVDYGKISEFQFFMMLCERSSEEDNERIIKGFNAARAVKMTNEQNGETVLVDPITKTAVDRLVYAQVSDVLRMMHGFEKKVEIACNRMARELLIDEDRCNRARAKEEGRKSTIATLVSSLAGKSGLQNQVRQIMENMTFYQLRDAIKRLEIIDTAHNISRGLSVGMIDAKKIDDMKLNWVRPI